MSKYRIPMPGSYDTESDYLDAVDAAFDEYDYDRQKAEEAETAREIAEEEAAEEIAREVADEEWAEEVARLQAEDEHLQDDEED